MEEIFYGIIMIVLGIFALREGDFWKHDLTTDFIGGTKIKFFILGIGCIILGLYLLIDFMTTNA